MGATARVWNLQRELQRSPEVATTMLAYSNALRGATSLPATIVEVIVLRVAVALGFSYSLAHHIPLALAAGLSEEKIRALHRRDPGPLDDIERTVVVAVDEVLEEGALAASSRVALAERLGEAAPVEVILVASSYADLSIVARSFAVELEDDLLPWLDWLAAADEVEA